MRQFAHFFLWLSLSVGITITQARAESSATALARILAAKGLLSASDVSRVESAASGDDAVRVLTSLLTQRGILTSDEASLVLPDAPAAVQARIVPAVYQPPAPAPQTVKPSTAPAPTIAAPPVTAASKLPVTIYGTILVNGFFDTAANNNQDVPLVLSKQGSDPFGNDKSFGMTARQSRFGLRFQGGQVANAKLSGNVEIDFLGGKAAFPNGANFDILRVRHAWARLDWQHWALVGGQDWSVFAPLNPASYASYAIPLFAASGNPWIRTPQVRVEYKQDIAPDTNVLFQVAGTDPNLGDEPTSSVPGARTPAAGERGRMPGIDSRLALQGKIGGRDAVIGFSGHYGRAKNSGTLADGLVRQVPFDSWGGAIDASLPLTKKFALLSELYVGRALGVYSASVGESYLPVGTPGERGVVSRGGWAQAQFFATPRIQFNLGYGIDAQDPNTVRVGDRWKNQSYDFSIFYKVSPAVTFAWEYRRMLSDFRNQAFANERGDVANLGIAYTF